MNGSRTLMRALIRPFKRAPALSVSAGLAVATGIAANLVAVTVFMGVWFRPTPVSDPGMTFRVHGGEASPGGHLTTRSEMSIPDFNDVAAGLEGIADVAGIVMAEAGLGEEGREIRVALISDSYFRVVQAPPVQGTLPPPGIGLPLNAAVLSERMWRTHLGADTNFADRQVIVDGLRLNVLAVMPESFVGTSPDAVIDVWLPLGLYPVIKGFPGALAARDLAEARVFGRYRNDGARTEVRDRID